MKKVILDCDPGLDDAVAIMMTLGAPDHIDLLGITTVAGNVGLEAVYENARNLCALAQAEHIPVFSGCPHSIMAKRIRAAEVHGSDGVGGVQLPSSQRPLDKLHSVDFIIETCLAAKERTITICLTGPMTNLAMALIKRPDIEEKIKEVVFMGGAAFVAGNCTPAAEFNIYADPHAAHVVMQADIPKVMLGLDVTHQTPCTRERLKTLEGIRTAPAQALAKMMHAYRHLVMQRDHGQNDCMMHDPCAIAYLIAPHMFSGRDYFVEIDTNAGPSLGKTLVDGLRVSRQRPNVKVIENVDADMFYELLFSTLKKLGG